MKTEVKVGLFVFLSFILILGSLFFLGKSSFKSEGKEYYVTFRFLSDLKKGSDIKFAGGILIGTVKDIEPFNYRLRVKIWIKKDFKLTSNIKFDILSEGMLGEKYLNISYTEETYKNDYRKEPFKVIKEGSTIEGEDSVSFNQVLKNLYVLGKKTSEVMDNINFMLNGITKRKDIERISAQTVKLLKDTSQIISNNKENINNLITEIVQGTKSFNQLLNKQLPQVIQNTNRSVLQISNEFLAVSQKLKIILDKVNRGDGLIGKALTDKRLANDLTEILKNLKDLSRRLSSSSLIDKRNKRNRKSIWN